MGNERKSFSAQSMKPPDVGQRCKWKSNIKNDVIGQQEQHE